MISSCDFSFVNLYLLTVSDKYLRYIISNKLYLSVHCFFFVRTFLKIIELIRRQFVDIFKVHVIVFIWIVQTVSINDINSLLIV